MADKDNANPIVHASSGVTRARPGANSSGRNADWWRDPAAAELSGGSGVATSTGEAGGSHNGSFWLSQDADGDEEEDEDVTAVSSPTAFGQGGDKLAKDEIDSQEIYDLVRSVSDPEHPLTLEQLAVVNAGHITVDEGDPAAGRIPSVKLEFTPTIPHCSMATLIGLSLRVRLLRSLPPRYKVDISIRKGTHQSETQVNKQLNDKERVAAAMENNHLLTVVQNCLSTAHRRGMTEAQALEQADRLAAELGLVA
ncbi:hypothetical protein V8E36_008174 [Tilletia maclaganii]